MAFERSSESHNPDTGKRCDRKVYTCKRDDIWITIEIPKNEKGSHHR